MASTTSIKRQLFAARYARKDARTRIYAALYGKQREPGSNIPSADPDRRFPYYWTLTDAKQALDTLSEAAGFTASEMIALQERLAHLRKHPPNGEG